MKRIIFTFLSLALLGLVVVEVGQFADYQEPRIATAVGAFDPSPLTDCTLANGQKVECVKGQDVEVRLYRGLGGRFWGCGVDCIARDAARLCGVRTYVGSHYGRDTVPPSKRVVIGGASMGGDKAVEVATELGRHKRSVDLLLTIDPVPWVDHKPDNILAHINWHNTASFQLGGGTPKGTIKTADIGVNMGHVALINSDFVRERAVKEICRLVTSGAN